VTWKEHREHPQLDEVRDALNLEQGSRLLELTFRDFWALDLRVATGSPALTMKCYPQGNVPGVQLGTLE
jgi:hypothetical protein